MRYLRYGLKALRWLTLALALLSAIGFAALIAANWSDDALSEAAQRALRYTPPTEQALDGNGYLIVMGLDAPAEGDAAADAMALGRKRLAREIERRRWVETHGATSDGMPPTMPPENSGDGVLPARLRCPAGQADCFRWYGGYRTEIHTLAQENRALLQRLSAAASARQFSNPAPFYLQAEFPPFLRLVRAHELWLAQASLEWTGGQPQRAMDIARQAAQLRSRLASNSNSLVASMIALAMQYRELRWLSDAIAHGDPQTPASVSKSIEELLLAPPESLRQAMEGEMRFVASAFYFLKDAGLFAAPWDEPPAWWQRPLNRAANLGYLPRQTLNLSVGYLQQVQVISGLPAHQLEAAFSNAMRQWKEDEACSPWKHLRNAAGICTAAIGMSSYQGFAERVADIDGYRRLVLLHHRATMQRIALADMPAWLAQSPQELRNPYTLQPMRWDAADSSLVFEGREKQSQNLDRSPIYRIRLGD
ncbi:MAG: hypothetical protein ACTS5V_09525 [Giesbergeria sp.]